jgi:predicted CoA-substrate-specific enzyme activase
MKVAGVDLGKAALKLVVARFDGAKLELLSNETMAHDGSPFTRFAERYAALGLGECDALGVTGLYADEMIAPALGGLPESACLEAALEVLPELPTELNLVSIGARGYSVTTRDARGRVTHLDSDKCSSGTGETMVKTAGRFGVDIQEADRLALSASEAIAITARCSVFAKSEMTHFGNQGKPRDQLFRGYFDSIARYVAALLSRVRVGGPVYLIGGGSRLGAVAERLGAHVGSEVIVPELALFFEAIGAARIAADQPRTTALPLDPRELVRPRERRIEVHQPARRWAERVTRLSAPPPRAGAEREPTVLGLDLGSTGSKAVLTSLATGELVHDVYDRTRGNPVEAAQRLVRTLLERTVPDVRAIGVTGSGREAVATVLRAAFPEHADRIVVLNEIVAHATAAIRSDEAKGRSLSVVEIGGQDAKFIQIADGQIVESDMNKACSAGTGSFLEEQALLHGVRDIEEFAEIARRAERPADLGQMCTVFVAEAAAQAESEGFERADIFAGFQYSVIENYKNRVMGQRAFAERVFFQGKPASDPALAWTLAAVTGREVIVPENPGAMGAWGIGLSAIDALGREALGAAPALSLNALLEASVRERGNFQCQDKSCATLCNIDKTVVAVGGRDKTVLSGGACPKFEVSSAGRPKLSATAPSAFDEREALLAPYLAGRAGERILGVPHVAALSSLLPWVVTFLGELGLGVRVLRSGPGALSRGEERCYSYDACAPIKVAHGVADADVDELFFPTLLGIGDRDGPGGKTCPMEQGAPAMIAHALRARGRELRVHAPVLDLEQGPESAALWLTLLGVADDLGLDRARALPAAQRAAAAQRSYEQELAEIGRRTLAHARETGTPVVLVCGELHVIHDPVVNATIPSILRNNGVLALPVDAYPIPSGIDALARIAWGDANRTLRAALAARERGDVYPLLVSSFGCGPASFAEQIFCHLMHGYPHSALEVDGHGGAAGYVTRIQAFLHGVARHDRKPSAVPAERLRVTSPIPERALEEDLDAQLVTFPVGDRLAQLFAAAFRSLGHDAVAAGPTSAAALAAGRKDCSGKECLPYQLIWGSFRQHLETAPQGKRTVLVQASGQGSCRNCMFSIKDQISLERLGTNARVELRHMGGRSGGRTGFVAPLWAGTVAWDIANQLAAYHRPVERRPGEVDELHAELCDDLERIVERPQKKGLARLREARTRMNDLFALVDHACRRYAELPRGNDELRTVLLTGDIYLRLDDFASDGLVRRLNERGLRVLVDPASTLVSYLSEERSAEILGLSTDIMESALQAWVMKRSLARFYDRARRLHPWLTAPDARAALEAADPVIGRHPLGEAPITVGTVLHEWKRGTCDGVVVVGPWGCAPALVSESVLRHVRDIPMLFVYGDGSPMNERRLTAFAYRIRKHPARSEAAAIC